MNGLRTRMLMRDLAEIRRKRAIERMQDKQLDYIFDEGESPWGWAFALIALVGVMVIV